MNNYEQDLPFYKREFVSKDELAVLMTGLRKSQAYSVFEYVKENYGFIMDGKVEKVKISDVHDATGIKDKNFWNWQQQSILDDNRNEIQKIISGIAESMRMEASEEELDVFYNPFLDR